MDGNNRYAKAHNLSGILGHKAGKDALDPLVRHCQKLGIAALTVFAFSSENWARSQEEVNGLMRLLQVSITQLLDEADNSVRIRFIGDRTVLDSNLVRLMTQAEAQTSNHSGLCLTIAVSYGGKWDLVEAAKRCAQEVAEGTLSVDDITPKRFESHISLSDLDAVDLLIRTGGDMRISNFLLWQIAYAELFFTPTLWPDFRVDEFDAILNGFAKRIRSFGKSKGTA